MLLSLRKTTGRPIANAELSMRDLMVTAPSTSIAVMRISPERWIGKAMDVKMHVEMNLQELKALRADINEAIERMGG